MIKVFFASVLTSKSSLHVFTAFAINKRTMTSFTFDLDPVLISLGPFQIRYYGAIFAATIFIGFLLWRRQMLRGGYSADVADGFFLWGVAAVLIGARLGHCFFYDPKYYLAHPVQILSFWHGGLSSHGATIGIVIILFAFAHRRHIRVIELMDRISFSVAVAAIGVRLGNFFNSEIVGRQTDLPWAVRFIRFDNGIVARHPSQLYEVALGLFVLLVLYLADRYAGREKRPRGLLTGLFLTIYFAGRFSVEFFKEYQVLDNSYLTMGQILSLIPFLCGVCLLIRTKRSARSNQIKV